MTPIGPNPSANIRAPSTLRRSLIPRGREEGVNPALIHAVVSVESNATIRRRYHAGAEGLMQLMPKTAERFGQQLPSVLTGKNLRAGISLSEIPALF